MLYVLVIACKESAEKYDITVVINAAIFNTIQVYFALPVNQAARHFKCSTPRMLWNFIWFSHL